MKFKAKRSFKGSIYNFSSRLPLVGGAVKRWKINRNYPIERQVVAGTHKTRCTQQSIIFFTVYKAASSFIGGFMRKIAREAGMTPVDLDGYFFNAGQGRLWEAGGRNFIKVPYCSNGYFYGPFRSFNAEIPDLDRYKIILVLRDPRDVMVSGYFSMYSHVPPVSEGKKELKVRMDRRKEKLAHSVDEYVLNKLDADVTFLDRYTQYHCQLSGKPNVLLLKYEEMVTDFESWLGKLLEFLGIDVGEALLKEIRDGSNFKVDKENVFRHKRQVIPGDYKRKLKPETIKILNQKAAKVLELYGYPLDE